MVLNKQKEKMSTKVIDKFEELEINSDKNIYDLAIIKVKTKLEDKVLFRFLCSIGLLFFVSALIGYITDLNVIEIGIILYIELFIVAIIFAIISWIGSYMFKSIKNKNPYKSDTNNVVYD